MFSRLRLTNFKNFADAQLSLGPLTLLVGTNASGKSNLREAFRFLHGVSRGYELAEILGEKWIEGGSLVWRGLRGGAREVVFQGGPYFGLESEFRVDADATVRYMLEVQAESGRGQPSIGKETLDARRLVSLPGASPGTHQGLQNRPLYMAQVSGQQKSGMSKSLQIWPSSVANRGQLLAGSSSKPALAQLNDLLSLDEPLPEPETRRHYIREALAALGSMRFLDLVPEALRIPSLPGQTILGDRGENLSSVLLAICEDASRRHALIEWLRELTPLDVTDFHFDTGPDGKVLVALVEADGRRTSALSASDGTLRFLALAAALLGPSSARFYFVEEIDNGIHPSRLHLLVQLIERHTGSGHIQIVATTHSPQMLGFLSDASREHASLVYRLPGQSGARIRRILDLPDIIRILKTQDLARLHAAGWMENAVAFTEADRDIAAAGSKP